jgi:hypothetical protein
MAYTAGADVAASEFVDEDDWNAYMGATGSLEYLKTEADKISTCTQTRYTSATKALATDYQNTSGKTRFVTVTLDVDAGANPVCYAYLEANDTTPDVAVAKRRGDNDSGDIEFITLSFPVPAGYYYKVTGTGTTIRQWVEWDFH